MDGVRVLDDVEIVPHRTLRVREERELRTDAIAELIDLELVVRRDQGHARIPDPEVEVCIDQIANETVLLRIKPAA